MNLFARAARAGNCCGSLEAQCPRFGSGAPDFGLAVASMFDEASLKCAAACVT